MPEAPHIKFKPHPATDGVEPSGGAAHRPPARYAELAVTSNFTFLGGASHPDELVVQAAELGYQALAIADTNTLAGIVRAHVAAQKLGLRLIVGCRLVFSDPADLAVLVYPTDLASYGRLCRLLTHGKRQAEKGGCRLVLHDLVESHEGLLAAVVPPAEIDERFLEALAGLRGVFDDDRLSLVASSLYGQDERQRLERLAVLSEHTGVPLVASNDVHYHIPDRRPLQDVITCIRLGCTLTQAGWRLHPNAERHLKPPDEMVRLLADYPRAIARTLQVAQRAGAFSLQELRYQYPDEVCPPGRTPLEHLADLTWQGAAAHWGQHVPQKVRLQIEHELALIGELNFAQYFLTVHDLVVFARSRGILCQGRGAAANSAVCFCLGVTNVDPSRIEVLFERFVSRERNEPPDIDIDFEHERREEVIQYIYGKYGRHRAALTAEIISYRGRSAVRDVGKALGLSLDCVDRLAKCLEYWGVDVIEPRHLAEAGLDTADQTLRRLVLLCNDLLGFPRHLSQHVGGFVITRDALSGLVPIENAAMPDRTVIEWDKDDIDAMGMLKVDCLGLGMLTCIRKCFELVAAHHGRPLTLATLPAEDPAVYDMICQADTVGVFQIESRAQMSMLPRLRPRCYYDLVIEVAIVRPGPIVGDMVHPYLRRRTGQEPVTYPDEKVRAVLSKTLGVPLFQEQAMRLAMVAAGFSGDQADQLRRAIGSKRSQAKILEFGRRLITGMVERGYPREFAERVFQQIQGFSSYGFPESHAASFAHLVYASAWLKRHYPAAFAAALLNSQPMGFYAPAQIVRDAQSHGVAVLPIDVNFSGWDCRLQPQAGGKLAVRLGMRLTKGLSQKDADAIAAAVAAGGRFGTIEGLWRASGVRVAALRQLAAADAFGSMGADRQQALWQIQALGDEAMPLLELAADQQPRVLEENSCPGGQRPDRLPPIPQIRKVVQDYTATGLSLRQHPLSFLRKRLSAMGVSPAGQLRDERLWPPGRRIKVAGAVLVRQRPSTASGTLFITLEDETGICNLMIRPAVYEQFRKAARHSAILLAEGTVQRQGQVVHVVVRRLEDISPQLKELMVHSRDFH
jgi:error-prone DNA polymerase